MSVEQQEPIRGATVRKTGSASSDQHLGAGLRRDQLKQSRSLSVARKVAARGGAAPLLDSALPGLRCARSVAFKRRKDDGDGKRQVAAAEQGLVQFGVERREFLWGRLFRLFHVRPETLEGAVSPVCHRPRKSYYIMCCARLSHTPLDRCAAPARRRRRPETFWRGGLGTPRPRRRSGNHFHRQGPARATPRPGANGRRPRFAQARGSLRPVINATGVVIPTWDAHPSRPQPLSG